MHINTMDRGGIAAVTRGDEDRLLSILVEADRPAPAGEVGPFDRSTDEAWAIEDEALEHGFSRHDARRIAGLDCYVDCTCRGQR